jgi:hypothetical protein
MMGARKQWIFIAGLTLALTGLLGMPGRAEAASGPCYFGNNGTCSVGGDGDYATNDIFTGRSSSGAGTAMGGVGGKGEFITYVVNRFNGSNAHNKTGAQFIIRTMLDGHGAHQSRPGAAARDRWVNLMQSSSVSFQIIRGATVCNTSWYVPSENNTFFDGYTSGCKTRDLIRIKQDGYVIADIEIACGNMTGRQDRVLHTWRMAATTSANASSVYPGQQIQWTHRVYYQSGNGETTSSIAGKRIWGGALSGTYGDDPTYDRRFSPGESVIRYGYYTPGNADVGKTFCQRINGDPTAYDDQSPFSSASACVVVKAVPITCSLSVSPADPDPYTPLRFTLQYNTPTTTTTTVKLNFHDYGSSYTATFGPTTVTSGNRTTVFTVNPPASGFSTGLAAALATVNAGGSSASCGNGANPLEVPINPQPFLAAYGADVLAGVYATSSGVCVNNATKADVVSWNHDGTSVFGAASNYSGAGGKAGVFASGNIGHFSSGLNITNLKPTGLSFANTSSTAVDMSSHRYGGQFAGTWPTGCNFMGGKTPTATYTANHNIAGLTLADNDDRYYVVNNANVYISADIVYANSGGGWTAVSKIPSFKLVVNGGNIYIGKNVSRLDGLYVATPTATGTKGEIFTCAPSAYTAPNKSSTSYTTDCNGNQLTVYGAFAAKEIHFDRTIGSVGQARASDTFSTDQAAERFIYSPDMWLPNGSDSNPAPIQSYQGLPPVL